MTADAQRSWRGGTTGSGGRRAALLLPALAGVVFAVTCRSSGGGGKSAGGGDAGPVTARLAEPADASGDAPQAAGEGVAREESARYFPEPYDNVWIGEPLAEFREDYPDATPYSSPADPERLEWQELKAPTGLLVRLGFVPGPTPETTRLRSVQFMSLLPAPASPEAPPTAHSIAAWSAWMTQAYQPLMEGLKRKYGEKADVYSCGGGAEHPIVRVVWRGKAIAVTEAFMLHDKGLSSTLMITPLSVVERYLQATQCRWVQDRVM